MNCNALRKPSGPDETRTINHLKLGEALRELNDPPIRALYIAANNPAVTNPGTGGTRAGLARDDLFTVVHDPFMTRTAKFADIVLPRRPIWRLTISIAPMARITCNTAPRGGTAS